MKLPIVRIKMFTVSIKEKNKVKQLFIHVLLPILLGGIIYISFRSKYLVLFSWSDEISISGFVNIIRNQLLPIKNYIPTWVIYSLPDGLWTYSFVSSFIVIWKNDSDKWGYWLLIPFVLSISYELLQYFKILQGTFDIVDFSTCLMASILSILIVEIIPKHHEKQNC